MCRVAPLFSLMLAFGTFFFPSFSSFPSSPSSFFFFLLFSSLYTFTRAAPTAISECQTLSSGGEFYLTRDLIYSLPNNTNNINNNSCLSFLTTDPVTLDGKGYFIRVSSYIFNSSSSFNSTSSNSTSPSNSTSSSSFFYSPLSLVIRGSTSVLVNDLRLEGGRGIKMIEVPNVQVKGVTILEGVEGIAVYNSTSVTLSNNDILINNNSNSNSNSAVVVSRANYLLFEKNNVKGGSGVIMDNIAIGYISENEFVPLLPSTTGVTCVVSCAIINVRGNLFNSQHFIGSIGINVKGTSMSIDNNKVMGYQVGVATTGVTASSTSLLENNEVQKFELHGIISYLTYATIRSNSILNGRGDGIIHEAPEYGVIVEGNKLINISSNSSRSSAILLRGKFTSVRNNVIQNTKGIMSIMLFQATSHTVQNNLVENVELSGQFYSISSLQSSIVFENNVVREIVHTSCDIATVVNFESMQDIKVSNCIF